MNPMKKFLKFLTTSFFLLGIFFLGNADFSFASTGLPYPEFPFAKIDNDDSQINFACDNCTAQLFDGEMTGYAWSENFGWINLNPDSAGVENDGDGNLSGFAWGANIGWINFDPENGGVTVDDDGYFSGAAWGQNSGWIIFDCDDPGACLRFDWSPTVTPPPGGGGGGGPRTYACSDGIDNDGDGFVDYPEDLGCESANDDSEILIACGTPNAENFNAQTNTHDESLCIYAPISGCAIEEALNFNPIAVEEDNESCIFVGCTNPTALNYDENADIGDGSCQFPPIPPGVDIDEEIINETGIVGCTDPRAENYKPTAQYDSGLCTYAPVPVFGCTDPSALNFKEDATSDNGSCVYAPVTSGVDDSSLEIKKSNIDLSFNGLLNTVSLISLGVFILGGGGAVANVLVTPIRLINALPALLGLRRKRRPWGTVYDSVTKQPLDPVYVELQTLDGKTIETSITDMDGRFSFLVPKGEYKIKAGKSDYVFPSEKLKGQTKDSLYDNLYFGAVIKKETDDEVMFRNIPLDPVNFNWNEFQKSKNKKLLRFYTKFEMIAAKISNIAFFSGIVFSSVALYFVQSVFNIVVVSVYALVVIMWAFGVRPEKPGFIVDKKTGIPLSFGVVRVFSATRNTEVLHKVISKTGKYFSLVPNGEYYLTVEEKAGEQEYKEVLKTEAFTVKKGHINRNIEV